MGAPNPRPRRLTKSEGQETLGAETRRERDEGEGATTGDREDTPSTPRLEPPGTMEAELEGLQSQVAARKEASQRRKNASRPELGELVKKERLEATATSSR